MQSLSHIIYIVLFSCGRLFCRLCCISECAVADPFVFALNTKISKNFLPKSDSNSSFAPQDPDACHTEALCGIHQVAHHKRAIIHMCWNCLIGKYHKNDRCSIERVHAFWCSHDLTVFFRKLVTQFLICHCKDDWGLFSHSRWCVGSGSYDLFKCFLRIISDLKLRQLLLFL